VFLLNSCLGLFSVSHLREPPLFRSYGVILQSSLTRIISRVFGFSPRLRVSVCGTGAFNYVRSFSWKCGIVRLASSHLNVIVTGFSSLHVFLLKLAIPPASSNLPPPSLLRFKGGSGISTRCPSATLFSLTLGPDLPREDEPYPWKP
jgi:hypothetical protein